MKKLETDSKIPTPITKLMKKTFSSKKSAFSLIELSIVLIIIGLLIAGVTGGAGLIRSAELRSVIGEARSYAVSVNAFYTQFSAYPGDYSTPVVGSTGAGTSAYGDNDGTIEYYTGSTSESAVAWIHLRGANIIDTLPSTITLITNAAPTFGNSGTSGANAPSSKIKSAGWVFDYRTITEGDSSAANQNVVVLTSTMTAATSGTAATAVNSGNISSAAMLGSDALSIDTKVDDGYANTGKVRGVNPASGSTCYTASSSSAVSYTVTSSSTKTCGVSYQVDVNS